MVKGAEELRGLLLIAGLCAAAYLMVVACIELLRQQQRVEIAVLRSDLAAYAVAQVLQEARDITAAAAASRR